MSVNFSPEADDQKPEQKKSQQMLLLLLLLLILLFCYLYFFTGLIRPRPEAPPPPKPAAENQIVKQPLPPRPSENVAQNAKPEEKPAATAPGAKAPEAPGKEAKPAPAAPGKPGPAAPGKPGQPEKGAQKGPEAKAGKPGEAQPGKPAAEAKAGKPGEAKGKAAENKAAGAAPGAAKGEKPGPQGAAQAKAGKPGPAEAGKAQGGKTEAAKEAKGGKPAGGKEAKAAAPGGKEAKKPAKEVAEKEAAPQPVKRKPAAAYTLEISDLPLSEVGQAMAKLKQAGIGQVTTVKVQRGETVHRLFLADFGDHAEAQEELERLKLAAPSAFMLKENGRYAVYGGSYMREVKAAAEQDRLFAKGVKLVMRTASAPVTVMNLRGGSFPDKAKADRAVNALKKNGVAAKVVRAAK